MKEKEGGDSWNVKQLLFESPIEQVSFLAGQGDLLSVLPKAWLEEQWGESPIQVFSLTGCSRKLSVSLCQAQRKELLFLRHSLHFPSLHSSTVPFLPLAHSILYVIISQSSLSFLLVGPTVSDKEGPGSPVCHRHGLKGKKSDKGP